MLMMPFDLAGFLILWLRVKARHDPALIAALSCAFLALTLAPAISSRRSHLALLPLLGVINLGRFLVAVTAVLFILWVHFLEPSRAIRLLGEALLITFILLDGPEAIRSYIRRRRQR